MFVDAPPVNSTEIFDTVSDIKAHLYKREGNIYTDPQLYLVDQKFNYEEIGTWAHENCHQINSNLRNNQSVKSNAAYWLNSKAYIRPEISTIKLHDVAKYVPEKLKGYGYNLYMLQQQQWWDDEPLYIIDELAAYKAGTKARIENDEKANYSCSLYIEFCGYLAVLVRMTEEFIPLLQVAISEAYEFIEELNAERDLIDQLINVEAYINGNVTR